MMDWYFVAFALGGILSGLLVTYLLHRLVNRMHKRVEEEENTVSVTYDAVDLAGHIFTDLSEMNALRETIELEVGPDGVRWKRLEGE